MENTKRLLLIDAILKFAGDEFEDRESLIKLALCNEFELIQKLINITKYYKNLSDE
jgi:hypothetical protein